MSHWPSDRTNKHDGTWFTSARKEEIAFHKAQELEEIKWAEAETFMFDDYLADFRANVHDPALKLGGA